MGLLSGMETTKRQRILQSLAKHEWWIGILMFVIGIVFFIALAHDSLNARLYVDENALMPGIATESFRGGNEAEKLAGEWERLTTRDQAVLWLTDKLTLIGVEVYNQNFTAPFPFPDVQQQQMISSTNVYGILRAPRGASVESIVLSSPYRLLTDGLNVQPSHYGVALLLSLAKHFRHLNYWSKDLIFLFYSEGLVGMQAWTEAYMGTKLTNINFSQLPGRSGNIDSAVNIDMPSAHFTAIDLDTAGINGMLPNYDVYSLSWKVATSVKHNIPTGPFGEGVHQLADPTANFVRNAYTMLRTASVQAVGLPSAGHGLLVRHRVEALTVRALPDAPYARRYGLQDMGNVVSGIVRSLNNLLEHLHHSFYFYILPNADHYVSVSLYTPPLALILLGSFLKAISLWVVTGLKSESSSASNQEQFAFGEVQQNIQLVLPAFLCSQLAGVAVYAAPNIGVLLMPSVSQADAAFFGLTSTAVVCMVFVPIIVRKFSSSTDTHNSQWAILHCFALFAHTMALIGLSMMNFAFGLLFSVISVIPTRILRHQPNQHILQWLLHQLIIVLASPPVVLWMGCLIYLYLNGGFLSLSLGSQLFETTKLLQAGILAALRHEHLTGTWAYAAVTLVLWPNWLLFWTASWKPVVRTGDDVTRDKKEQ